MSSKVTVEKDIVFNSDLVTVIHVLLDTEGYPRYIKNIKSAKVVHKTDFESEVSFKAKISFFPFEYSIKTTKVSDNKIVFEQKNGFFSLLSGEWRLKENNGQVYGTYAVNVELPSFAAGTLVKKALNLYFPEMLNDFKDEIERQFKI